MLFQLRRCRKGGRRQDVPANSRYLFSIFSYLAYYNLFEIPVNSRYLLCYFSGSRRNNLQRLILHTAGIYYIFSLSPAFPYIPAISRYLMFFSAWYAVNSLLQAAGIFYVQFVLRVAGIYYVVSVASMTG